MNTTSTAKSIVSTENKPRSGVDVSIPLEMLASVMSYFDEAGVTVLFKNDLRDPDMPVLVLRLPNVLAVQDDDGKYTFKAVAPDASEPQTAQ